ncbi:MAG: DUF2203 domain-containing protein [Candidatus Eisenbacteria bacterium]|uniref:DUF2203 domain-containing protein n=1 Tax=Eiseniibacteriota bacterium TaxID=2212470 RepID=A0A948W5V9_UNCEI|nr:DUF2203 domain-containing protein [Candidatus Eisenbacteria bacterium]MBU1949372.1 DUF2203 domain-containing protein [Candidatus Eisenbacteria bacterium]MBU2690445.1 DUF2203 domain-containing protein [Candidatus Eisenbacteria bacterium]
MAVKIFTLEEANRLLPHVDAVLKKLIQAARQIQGYQDRIAVLELIGASHRRSPERREYLMGMRRLEELIAERDRILEGMQRMGCVVKDFIKGQVDFYGATDGRFVFFCWKLGEKQIQYWHELNKGTCGRRPLSEL